MIGRYADATVPWPGAYAQEDRVLLGGRRRVASTAAAPR